MRWLPKAIPVLIAIIALDLALVFGFEAWRIFNSPVYGLDQLVFANLVHGLGRLGGLKGQSLYNLAAFFAAVYLTISGVLALHIASRFFPPRARGLTHDLLDAALILVVVSTILAATPAIMQGATEILVQQRLPLWLVGLAATLSMIERLPEADTRRPGLVERLWARFAERRKRRDAAPLVSPQVRNQQPAIRWNSLRSEAGMAMQAAKLPVDGRPRFGLRGR